MEDVITGPDAGTLNVTVIEAKGYNQHNYILKPYVALEYGDVKHKTSHCPWSNDSQCAWCVFTHFARVFKTKTKNRLGF